MSKKEQRQRNGTEGVLTVEEKIKREGSLVQLVAEI